MLIMLNARLVLISANRIVVINLDVCYVLMQTEEALQIVYAKPMKYMERAAVPLANRIAFTVHLQCVCNVRVDIMQGMNIVTV